MGLCVEFGTVITTGCNHPMVAGATACRCPECGTVCKGRFVGCPEVWAAGPKAVPAPSTAAKARSAGAPVGPAPVAGATRATPAPSPVLVPPAATETEAVLRKAKEGSGTKVRAEAQAMLDLLERSFEKMTAELAARAREIDDRAADHMRALDYDRASLPKELRQSVAGMVPSVVDSAVDGAVRQAVDARLAAHLRTLEHDGAALRSDLRKSIDSTLPRLVADAVRQALDAREPAPEPPPAALAPTREETAPARSDHEAIVAARQRSLERRVDGLTRRAQEIDDRVSTHLRGLDDDRAVLSDLVRHQDRLAQSLADADVSGHYQRLSAWVTEAVPGMVAEAVQSAMEVHGEVLAASLARSERARADAQAVGATVQASAERILESLYRRDQEFDERAAARVKALDEQRAALEALLDGGTEQVAQSVLVTLPALVESAVRVAMERYRTERRTGVEEIATRMRADSDVMRDALQRSFEKMMEALAAREQVLDERAAAHVRALEHEKGELATLWDKAARSVTAALPGMVAEAVRDAREQDRSQLAAAREETERLRRDLEAAAVELRAAVAEVRAELGGRDELIERQASAYERAVDGLRSAMNRPPPAPAAAPEPEPSPSPTPPTVAAAVVAPPETVPVRFAASTVPPAKRVERRMLKIADDAAWPALNRREAALSDLLDEGD